MAQKKSNKRYNGDGSFSWIDSKKLWKYSFTISNQYKEDGRAVRKAVYGKTQDECRRKAQETTNKYLTGTIYSTEDITIYQYGMRLIEKKLKLNKIQPQSADREIETLKILKPIYNTCLRAATRDLIQNFLVNDAIRYADNVIGKVYGLLRYIFREALDDKIISDNPMKKVEKPKSNKKDAKVRALTVEEERALIKLLTTKDIRYSAEMLLSLFTGMRMGEVLALKVSDIDFKIGYIDINKTMAKRSKGEAYINTQTKTKTGMRKIRVNKEVINLLKVCCADKGGDDYIFTRKGGGNISTPLVCSQFRRLDEKYHFIEPQKNAKVDLHSLRHTYATRCIESGMQAKVLQHRLGHKNITTTYNTYGDVFDRFEFDNLEKADAYMLKMGLTMEAGAEEADAEGGKSLTA